MSFRKRITPETSRERERVGYQLRLQGKSFDAIGQALKISRQAAVKAVARYEKRLEAQAAKDVAASRSRISVRLEALYASFVREMSRSHHPAWALASLAVLDRLRLCEGLVTPDERRSDVGVDLDPLERLHEALAGETYGNQTVYRSLLSLDRIRAGERRRASIKARQGQTEASEPITGASTSTVG
jgi:hypothetical protein